MENVVNNAQSPNPYASPQSPSPGHAPTDDALVRAMLPVGRTGLSLVAGYLGLLALFVFPAPLALAVGIWAVVDLKKQPGKTGAGRAWFAIIAGAIGTAVLTLLAFG